MSTNKVYFALFILFLFVVQILSASFFVKRSIPDNPPVSSSNIPKTICQRNTPCGWAVYTKYSRVIEYFMKNRCECADNKRCYRSEDDISIAAFVYRCKEHDPNKEQS